MADVYFAKLGQEQQIPFVVIKHSRNEIKEYPDSNQVSIYMHSRSDTKGSHHNTKIMQNMIVKSLNWQIHYPKKFLRILVIGRFKTNEKGGIFKSSYLLSKNLSSLGHKVETCCLTELNQFDFGLNCFDFSIIYAPDPGRPDFANCIDKVKHLNRLGVVCAVNFSFNLNIERTQWIREQLDELNEEYKKPQCFFASFSNASAILLGDKYRDRVVTFPKTIFLKQSMSLNPSYTEREGIFLGDIAKLGDKTLTQGDAVKWIEQIRKELPHVNIYALKHYHSEIRLPGYIQVLPYTGEIEKMLVRFRLCVNLTPGATFEMIPLEAMLSGTPVIHRRMPQSLSEYLSPNSIEVDSAHELGEVCKRLYENKVLWKKLNRAGFGAYDFFRVENVISALELSIRKCLIRAGKKEIE
jgi:glycosyltransferase involved in cell wall biosynthesis